MVLNVQPVMMAIVASFSGRISDRKNPRIMAAIGMGASSLGLFMLSFIEQGTSITYILIALFVLGFGFGMFSSPNTNVIMGSVDRKVYGTASAMVSTMRTTGMMFSMAIASLIIHWYLGTSQINLGNQQQFVSSTKLIFSVFTVLCLFGVYTAIARTRKK